MKNEVQLEVWGELPTTEGAGNSCRISIISHEDMFEDGARWRAFGWSNVRLVRTEIPPSLENQVEHYRSRLERLQRAYWQDLGSNDRLFEAVAEAFEDDHEEHGLVFELPQGENQP